MRLAVYPGTFDPVTRGHLSVIERIHYPDTLDLGSSVVTPLHEGQVLAV